MVKTNISFYERKKLLQKHEIYAKEKAHNINFLDEENVDIMRKRRSFSTQEVVRKIFL